MEGADGLLRLEGALRDEVINRHRANGGSASKMVGRQVLTK
jgi:hypothetical protein